MKKIMIALLLACPLINGLSIMTYNTPVGAVEDGLSQHQKYELRWTARQKGIINLIKNLNPTVFGCQEPQDYQSHSIAYKLRKSYDWYGKPNKEIAPFGIDALSWTPLIFDNNLEFAPLYWQKAACRLLDKGTFWLSGEKWQAQEGTDVIRICSWVKLQDTTNNRIFYVFNTHLDHHSDALRIAGMQEILAHIPEVDAHTPIFIIGDFNMPIYGAM